MPLVSIITPSWNSAAYIEQTILSVINQSYKNVEYIIVDGGSTDGTLDIIRKYENSIHYWESEPDNGMYQAINKGMKRASGEIIAYLNSDDLYFQDSISRVVDVFRANPNVDLIFGNLAHINESGDYLYTKKYPAFEWRRFASSGYAMIGQPAAFWRKSLNARVGLFDETMKMAADFDFFIRAGLIGQLLHVDIVLASFRLHSKSLTGSQLQLSKEEVLRIHSKYIPDGGGWPERTSDLLFKLLNWRAFFFLYIFKVRSLIASKNIQ